MFADAATADFFHARLDHMIDLRQPLVVLASHMPWQQIEASLAHLLSRKARTRLANTAHIFQMMQFRPFCSALRIVLHPFRAVCAAFAACALISGALIPAPPAIGGAPSTGSIAQTAS